MAAARMRALAVMLVLAVAAVEVWLAWRDAGRGRLVAASTAAALVVAAVFLGRPRVVQGGRGR